MIAQEDSQDNQDLPIFAGSPQIKLWERRYSEVQNILVNNNITKILDIGCAEAKFIQRLSRSPRFSLLIGLDLNEQLLRTTSINNIVPQLIQDSLLYDRIQPLISKIYSGDATIPHPNLKSQPIQAITLIQLIEHLPLARLPFLNDCLFKYYEVDLIIMTTPNSDFNEFFNEPKGKMRHWDHKFEWSQSEFQQYCEKIKQQYGYDFQLFGVGQHITEGTNKGYCSQGAIFRRKAAKGLAQNIQNQKDAELISVQRYPYWQDFYQGELRNLAIQQCYRQSLSEEDDYFCSLQQLASVKRIKHILDVTKTSLERFKQILGVSNILKIDSEGRISYIQSEQEEQQQQSQNCEQQKQKVQQFIFF